MTFGPKISWVLIGIFDVLDLIWNFWPIMTRYLLWAVPWSGEAKRRSIEIRTKFSLDYEEKKIKKRLVYIIDSSKLLCSSLGL